MHLRIQFIAFVIATLVFFPNLTSAQWKVGTAKIIITPKESMWLAGYAARDRPSEGAIHDLWAKAMVLEDNSGNKGVIVTADLIRFHKSLTDEIKKIISSKYGLSESQIILNPSHTHSGPEVNPERIRFQIGKEQTDKIIRYSKNLTEQIVELVGEALKNIQPATVHAGNGTARFAVNRRTNSEAEINQQKPKYLLGPNDYAVPVLKVAGTDGKLLAVLFGYACHPTVLAGYEWSGDYAGFAQYELEAKFPEATFLFFQGAGGDQNPLPRRSVSLARQYGRTLAASVMQVLEEETKLKPLPPTLSMAYSEIALSAALKAPTVEELQKVISKESAHPEWIKNSARSLLEQIKNGVSLSETYAYPVQVWNAGGHPIISLSNEVVVEYAIQLRRLFGQHIFVMGYSNDVTGYIPSVRILEEGGYEGERSHLFTSPWRSDIESRIIDEVIRLGEKTGIPYNR